MTMKKVFTDGKGLEIHAKYYDNGNVEWDERPDNKVAWIIGEIIAFVLFAPTGASPDPKIVDKSSFEEMLKNRGFTEKVRDNQ